MAADEEDRDAWTGLAGRSPVARAVAVVAALPFAVLAVAWATATGWSALRPGVARLREDLLLLGSSAVCGVLAAALLLSALGRRSLSPWLLLGVVPALWAGVQALGA